MKGNESPHFNPWRGGIMASTMHKGKVEGHGAEDFFFFLRENGTEDFKQGAFRRAPKLVEQAEGREAIAKPVFRNLSMILELL
jgi:hypothetical protein